MTQSDFKKLSLKDKLSVLEVSLDGATLDSNCVRYGKGLKSLAFRVHRNNCHPTEEEVLISIDYRKNREPYIKIETTAIKDVTQRTKK
jgi:hypothetical protein